MKNIAAVLLIGVFFRHTGHRWLGEFGSIPQAGWFYILGGAWEVVLCGLLLLIFMAYERTLWVRLAIAAMLISMIEGAQIAVCRLPVKDMSAVPKGTNLCDYVTGLPVGATLFTLYILIICVSVARWKNEP